MVSTLPFTAQQLVDVLVAEEGYSESPAGSNRTKYGAAMGMNGVPWCALFPGWGFRQLGADLAAHLGVTQANRAWTPSFLAAGHRNRLVVPVDQARAGDLVLFDFPGGKDRVEHIGVVLGQASRARLRTVEGNTGAGDDTNGGQVQVRLRPHTHVAGVVRPRYASAPTTRPATEDDVTQDDITAIAIAVDRAAAEREKARRRDDRELAEFLNKLAGHVGMDARLVLRDPTSIDGVIES